MSEKLSCVGLQSPTSNQHKDWDDKPPSQKFLEPRHLFRNRSHLKHAVPLWRTCSSQPHVLLSVGEAKTGASTASWALSSGHFRRHQGSGVSCGENFARSPRRSRSSCYCTLCRMSHFSVRPEVSPRLFLLVVLLCTVSQVG